MPIGDADGLLQRAYNYVGLRDYFKRMKVMFHENGVPTPNLWQHVTSGAAYHAWFGDVFFEGENVEPTDLNYDYLEVLPAGRMRAIGSSVCAGGVMTMMCQSDRHRSPWYLKHNHQFLGWVMAHDILPEQLPLYPKLVEAGHLWADKVAFLPYWKPGPFATKQADCLVSAHLADGRALLWVVNKSRKDADVKVTVDWKAIGMDPQQGRRDQRRDRRARAAGRGRLHRARLAARLRAGVACAAVSSRVSIFLLYPPGT